MTATAIYDDKRRYLGEIRKSGARWYATSRQGASVSHYTKTQAIEWLRNFGRY